MNLALQFLAALSTCLFAGAAIYINFVEHPARMSCDTKTAATVWAPSYKEPRSCKPPWRSQVYLQESRCGCSAAAQCGLSARSS